MPLYCSHNIICSSNWSGFGREQLSSDRFIRRCAFYKPNIDVCTDFAKAASHFSWSTESTMEALIERLMNLHASSATFRQIFRSQQTTQLFVDAYKAFVSRVSEAPEINHWTSRILEKLTHFGLALALDNSVAGSQKQEVYQPAVMHRRY